MSRDTRPGCVDPPHPHPLVRDQPGQPRDRFALTAV